MAPDYRAGNPYQEMLRRALEPHGVEVVFPIGYKRGFPLFRGMRAAGGSFHILHLHWLSPFIKRGPASLYPFYAVRLLLDLLLCRLLLSCRIVWTVHNLASHEDQSPAESIVRRILARRAHRVFVHSHAALARVRDAFGTPPHHMKVIPHGEYRQWYGDPPSRAAARLALGLPAAARTFLFLGLLRPYKGIEPLIETWRSLAPANAVLLIAGQPLDDTYLARLRQAAGPDPAILFRPGRVEDAEIPALLAAADFFVLPLQHILTSGSLLLAQSYSLPVIAPAHPFVQEALGSDAIFLYSPSSPSGLRDSLARALASAPFRPSQSAPSWSAVAALTAAEYAN